MIELQHDMASQVSLDVDKAVKSFKTLTSAVTASTSEWKANEAAAKRNGDGQKAQQIKIEGLTKSINLQKAKLEDLKKQQAAVNTSTEKGTKRYYDLTNQITKTNAQINKQSDQLSKAKSGMTYYTSGLADLQKGYKQATQLSQSYISRLEAEGKTEEANRAKLDSYRNSVDHLSKQLAIQESELSKVASANGKNSEAYQQQQIRVNKTATSLAKAKTQLNDFSTSLEKPRPMGFFTKIKAQLHGTEDAAKETKTSIGDIVKGSAIGTGITNILGGLSSSLMGAAKQGFNLAKSGKEISENWEHIGVAKKGVKELTGQIGEIRGVSNASGAAITKLQTGLYGLTSGNIKQTKALTNELYAFGKAGGASEDQIVQVGGKLTRIFSAAKVNLGAFNKTFATMPGLKVAIQKASGMTKSAFNDALANGKISGAQMKKYMLEAANGSGKAWEKFGETTEGKIAKTKGTWTNFTAAVMKPLANTALDGLSKGLDRIIGKNGKLNETGKHIQSISGELSKNVGKSLINAINFIATHTNAVKAMGVAFATYFAVSKFTAMATTLFSFVTGIKKVITAIREWTVVQKLLDVVMSANPIGIAVAAVAALAAGFILLYKNCKPFRTFINGIGKQIQRAFSNVPSIINKVIKWFSKLFSNVKSTFNKIIKNIKNAWKSVTKGFNSFKNSFKKNWDKFWNKIHDFFKKNWDKILAAFKSWGKSINSFLNTFSKDFKKVWNGLWSGVKSIFNKAWSGIKRLGRNAMNGLIDIVNGGISAVNNVIHAFGGGKQTIKLLGHVKLAKGTDSFLKSLSNPITKPVIATLNDGTDSPETGNKEMLIDDKGNAGIVQGQNTKALLWPGMHVINARETAMLMGLSGFKHFAKGTDSIFGQIGNAVGGFVNGIGSWVTKTAGNLKKYFDLATKIVSHPIKYLESLFKWTDSKSIGGAMTDLTHGAFNKAQDSAKSWWSALWQMAGGDLNGSSSKLLELVEKYGEGHKYVWGAAGPSTFDCSGLVMYALKKGFGISYPHFSGSQYSKTQHISKAQAKSGDLVFWGEGGNEHVGVYAGGNRYFSAQSPSQGIHMNTLDSVVGYGAPKFGRVKGLKQDSGADTHATSDVQRYIKIQVGNGFFSFIRKLDSMFGGGDLGGGKPSGSHKNWLAEAGFKPSDFGYITYIVDHESGWNPKATNPSSGAYGLPQSLPGNKMAAAGSDWRTNPITQLRWMKSYVNSVYGGAKQAYEFWIKNHAYANGGLVNQFGLYPVAEQNKPEMIIPLDTSKKNRATQLLDETTRIVKGNDESILNSNIKNELETIITVLGSIANPEKINKVIDQLQLLSQNPVKVDTKVNLDGKTLAKQLEKYQIRRAQGGQAHYAF